MKKYTKTTLLLSIILTTVTLSGCIQKTPYKEVRLGENIAVGIYNISDEELATLSGVTDPIIAHIPLKAHLRFHFHKKTTLNRTVNITYVLTPSTDVRMNVSDGIVLPEGIVFVESDLLTDYTTLSKNKTYLFNATIKVVKHGSWKIYASPGVCANVTISENEGWAVIHEVIESTALIKEIVSDKQHGILMTATNDWLRAYGAPEYEQVEFNCSKISGSDFDSYGCEMPCYGCEIMCYSDSTLVDRYYFVIEDNRRTSMTKIRNVYRWPYSTPSGYQSDPVCEEIRIKNIGQGGMMVEGNVVTGNDGKIIGRIYETEGEGTLFVPAK